MNRLQSSAEDAVMMGIDLVASQNVVRSFVACAGSYHANPARTTLPE